MNEIEWLDKVQKNFKEGATLLHDFTVQDLDRLRARYPLEVDSILERYTAHLLDVDESYSHLMFLWRQLNA